MPYFEIAKLRERCLGSSANTSQDAILNNFGAQADGKIDDLISIYAQRLKVTTLPILPLPADLVTQNLKDAATDLAASFFFRQKHQFEASKQFKESAKEAIEAFVIRLKTKGKMGLAVC